MPQIGWFEILVVVGIAIVVIGPKDFPVMLKKIGSWIGSIKRTVSSFQNQITELDALNSEDFKRILKEPDNSLIKQYKALLKTEKVDLDFTEDGIDTIASIASEVNSTVENIGARRLHTIIERVLDEISFTATDRAGEKITVNSEYIKKNLGELVKDTDLSKFIL